MCVCYKMSGTEQRLCWYARWLLARPSRFVYYGLRVSVYELQYRQTTYLRVSGYHYASTQGNHAPTHIYIRMSQYSSQPCFYAFLHTFASTNRTQRARTDTLGWYQTLPVTLPNVMNHAHGVRLQSLPMEAKSYFETEGVSVVFSVQFAQGQVPAV